MTDNLLDLSRVEFFHSFISGGQGFNCFEMHTEQVDGRVSVYHSTSQKVTPLFKLFFDKSVDIFDGRAHLHWECPGQYVSRRRGTAETGYVEEEVALPGLHLMAPETEFSTHYFWSISSDREIANTEVDGILSSGLSAALENEDEPMVRAFAERMAGRSLFEMLPVLLRQDEAVVCAHRALVKRIEEGRYSKS